MRADRDRDHQRLLATLAREVRGQRKVRGWTRKDLAEAATISERFLADIEAGRANPSVVKLFDLARSLGTSVAALIGEIGHGLGEPDAQRSVIALLGLRGAGKSTVGRLLAGRLGLPFVELDEQVEKHTGLPIGQIFMIHGEDYYRRIEGEILRELLEAPERTVLATGGGLVTERETWSALRSGALTVWLKARPEEHWQRVVEQGDLRPMAGKENAFAELRAILSERERLYRQADLTIDTSGRTVEEVCDEVVQGLAQRGYPVDVAETGSVDA